MKEKTNHISLGTCLLTLYGLSHNCYKNQVSFFKDVFPTFHRNMSARCNFEYELNQARVSQILRGRELLPRDACILYMGSNGDAALRFDVESYLAIATASHKQKAMHLQELLALVRDSNNLDPIDKEYILSCADNENSEQVLHELLFRMLHILIREPLQVSA